MVDRAAERAARADIDAELRELDRYRSAFKVVALADAIDYRIGLGIEHPTIYLLARRDGTLVVGSLPEWPEAVEKTEGWYRFRVATSDSNPSAALARVVLVQGEFPLLLARVLTGYNSLVRYFLPFVLGTVLLTAALLLILIWRAHRQLQRRLQRFNEVLAAAGSGELTARLSAADTANDDELGALARQVNRTLADNTRLVHGLETISQTAAHELNKALSHLRNSAADSGNPDLTEDANRLLQLLQEILELSRVETSSNARMQPTDLAAAVDSAVQLYADAFDDAGVALELTLRPANVLGQKHLLTNAVANLLSNALRYGGAGPVAVVIDTQDQAATVSVRDSGPGPTTADLQQLIDRSRFGSDRGYGFGLRFVSAIAIRHGAMLRCRQLAPGFEVSLTFPHG